MFLKKVMGSRQQIDKNFETNQAIGNNGYEIVRDLLLNAERRASQRRYDDAIGRLYRALDAKMSDTIGGFIQASIAAVAMDRSPNQFLQFPTALDFVKLGVR